jgi:DNA-binding CsgD family transcriptional regulator
MRPEPVRRLRRAATAGRGRASLGASDDTGLDQCLLAEVSAVGLGGRGVTEARAGTHLCALYSGPAERDRLLVPFIQEGLCHGDECVCVLDDVESASLRRWASASAGVGDPRPYGHLRMYTTSDVRLRADTSSVEHLAAVLAETLRPSRDDEWPRLRAAAELPWPHLPGADGLMVHESAVNEVLVQLSALFLCMYDLQQIEPRTLVDVLRIHSEVVLEGTVLDNRRCLEPADLPPSADAVVRYPLARLRGAYADGGDQWLDLTGAEVRVADLVARGMTNRATAEELNVSPHTVDAHLKHMYAKLGIHSRVELTLLTLQHSAPAT